MTIFSKRSLEGELELDHRASPGLPHNAAHRRGYRPEDVGEGTVHRAPSYGCPHCGSVVIMNPGRARDRETCYRCNTFVCDYCAAAMKAPGYEHLSFKEMVDKVQSGKYTVVGDSMSSLRLVQIRR